MRLWTYCIASNHSDPAACGFVWAKSAEDPLAVVSHPAANVYELPEDADCEPGEALNPLDRSRLR